MTKDITHESTDGRQHEFECYYIYHPAYPATREDPGEPECVEIEEITCSSCNDACEEAERVFQSERIMQAFERICLEDYRKQIKSSDEQYEATR